jgi:hypothetical protein
MLNFEMATLCHRFIQRSGLLSIQYHTKITSFSKPPEKMLPSIGLKDHIYFVILRYRLFAGTLRALSGKFW